MPESGLGCSWRFLFKLLHLFLFLDLKILLVKVVRIHSGDWQQMWDQESKFQGDDIQAYLNEQAGITLQIFGE